MKTWKLLLAAMMALVMLFAVTALAEDGVEANSLFPHKHYYGEWDVTKDATCTEAGVKTRECRWPLCEHKETCEIPAKGHDFGEWTVTTPATCEEDGVETHTCSRCDATETRTIPATGPT